MKKLMMVPLLAFTLAFAVNMPVSFAQEDNNEDKFSFGKVVSINADQIMVREYDFAKDADVEVAYTVTADTEFGNVNAVAELVADDDIVIDYVEKDGKRVVTTLVREEKGVDVPVAAEAEALPAVVPPLENVPAPEAPAVDAAAAEPAAEPAADAAAPVQQ